MESTESTKTSRAQDALRTIGPAVFNGGFSTFLGVILLVNAQTVAAFSFFKVKNISRLLVKSKTLVFLFFLDFHAGGCFWSVSWPNIFTCTTESIWI
jgi:hypothetical protein